jgi:hypothetical protein
MVPAPKVMLRPVLVGLASGTVVATAATAGQWLFNVYLHLQRFHGIGLVGPIISFVVTALLVGIIQFRAQQRRRARLARTQVVMDCNHEIRNALQTLVALHYPQESLEQIRTAVSRIDWALRDLLPRLQEDDAGDSSPSWEITDGRLRVKGPKPDRPEGKKKSIVS